MYDRGSLLTLGKMKITFLPSEEFENRYKRGFIRPDFLSVEALETEWEDLRDRYRASLSRYWTECCLGEEDFAISDDWHCSFYHCGGTTSAKAECFRFLELVQKEILISPHASEWLFHLTVGVESEHEGEIIIESSGFYANSSRKYDYSIIRNEN
jgi:hypothetical protein